MAFDITKPSMTAADWPTCLADIRENFRAIVQGDSGVFNSIFKLDGGALRMPGVTMPTLDAASWLVSETAVGFMIQSSGTLRLRTNGSSTDRVVIDGSGHLSIIASNCRIGGSAASARLHVGGGGTGTGSEELWVDAGSGAGGYVDIQMRRNGVAWGNLGIAGSAGQLIANSAANDACLRASQAILFSANGGTTRHGRLTSAGNWILGAEAALATNATDGFTYMPSGAGAPTGTPTAFTGKVAFYYDSTNNRIYIYNGAWRSVAVT